MVTITDDMNIIPEYSNSQLAIIAFNMLDEYRK